MAENTKMISRFAESFKRISEMIPSLHFKKGKIEAQGLNYLSIHLDSET